jgi:hypothetical protein
LRSLSAFFPPALQVDVIESCGADLQWRLERFTLPEQLSFCAAATLGRDVVVLGGSGRDVNTREMAWSRRVFKIDLVTGEATRLPDMLSKRCMFAAVALNGRIYAMGGQSALRTIPDYSQAPAPPRPHPRSNLRAALEPQSCARTSSPLCSQSPPPPTLCHPRASPGSSGMPTT